MLKIFSKLAQLKKLFEKSQRFMIVLFLIAQPINLNIGL